MRRSLITLTALAGATVAASPAGAAAAARASLPIPSLPASSSFAQRVDNPWFPLIPGTVFEYRGEKDGKLARDVLTVTHSHRTILGIRAAVVSDRLYLNGRLAERTTDWYAQEK